MTVNFMNFINNIPYLVEGWLSIFVVMGLIIVITMILNKIK